MKKIAAISGPAMGHVGRLSRACCAILDHTEVSIDFIYPQQSVYVESIVDSRFRRLPQCAEGKSFLERSTAFSNQLIKCFNDTEYDLIVHDANPLAWLSTISFPSCPRVNITNAFLTSIHPAPTVQEINFNQCYRELNNLRASRGLSPLESAYELYEADKVLLADPGPIVNLLADIPEHYVQCGACSWSMRGPLPQELNALNDILLMSMGSTGKSIFDAHLLRKIKKFVGSSTLIYAGSKLGDLSNEYEIHYRYEWLPLSEILTKCKAVIAQGGAGSSYQALSAGCPVIVIPTHRNHEILGRLIERLGVGLCIADPADLERSIEQFDFPTIRKQSLDFARIVRSEDGPNAIAREILALL